MSAHEQAEVEYLSYRDVVACGGFKRRQAFLILNIWIANGFNFLQKRVLCTIVEVDLEDI